MTSGTVDTLGMLGLEIRDRGFRLIQSSGATSYTKITDAVEWDIPSDAIVNGVVRRPRQLAELLQEHLASEAITAKRCAFSIPSRYAFVRDVTLPVMDQQALNEAARFRLKKSLPFPVDSAYVEVAPITVLDEDGNGTTMAVAVPKDIVDSRADALAYAGLEPIFAETDVQSILRVVHRRAARLDSLARDSSMTIIDVGSNTTSMYVVQQRRLQFLRSVKFGIFDLYGKIQESAKQDGRDPRAVLEDPESYVRIDGQLEFKQAGAVATVSIREELGRLIREVSRLMRYFQSLHPERSFKGLLNCMLMCGELAGVPGFLEYFEAQLQFKAEMLRPLFEANLGTHARIRDFTEQHEAKFVTATGCLLRAIEDEAIAGGMNYGRKGERHIAA